MAELETALICLSFVIAVGIVAWVYFTTEIRKETLRQAGISERAGLKQSAYTQRDEWYIPIIQELLKNPEMQNVVISLVKQFPEISAKFAMGQITKKD